jgi:uncharacterized protein YfaS (alpha-2-macroglobulin family)
MKVSSLQRSLLAFALLVAFVSQAGTALAGDSGGIVGKITDAHTGAPISGVNLQITSKGQIATATTDAKGHFSALNLQPDDYEVTAVKSGYFTRTVSGYTVYADQTLEYDLQLYPSPPGPGASPGTSHRGRTE